MKKPLMLTIAALLMIMTLTSFAKTVISDEDLNDMTAEQGVSITFNSATVTSISLTSFAWGDSSGFTGYTGAGYAGISNITMTGNLAFINGTTMNVDVGTSGTVTAVNLLMPTIQLGTMNVDMTLKLDKTKDFSSGTGPQILGDVAMRGFATQVTGGVTVFAH